MWTFKSFTRPDGRKLVAEWYDGQDGTVQAAFITALKLLRALPPDGWDRPDVGQLRRECAGLYEIVLKVNKVQHRPIGYKQVGKCFPALSKSISPLSKALTISLYRNTSYDVLMSGHSEFTILIFAIEKDRKLPPGTCETAKKRIEIINNDKERVSEFRIPK